MKRQLAIIGMCIAVASCGAARVEPAAFGPTMRPGDNCLRCHNERSSTGAPPWSAAGTVFSRFDSDRDEGVEGVTVTITDAAGKVVTLTTNEVGNFYTAEQLLVPFRVAIERDGVRKVMPEAPPAGSCNACHSIPPVGGAPGRIAIEPG